MSRGRLMKPLALPPPSNTHLSPFHAALVYSASSDFVTSQARGSNYITAECPLPSSAESEDAEETTAAGNEESEAVLMCERLPPASVPRETLRNYPDDLAVSRWTTEGSVSVTTPEKIVVGKSGSTVILPCLYSTTVGNQFVIEWKFSPGNPQTSRWQQIYYFSDGTTYKPGSQADRLSTVQNPPTSGVASIQLTNIAWLDNGSYICEVNNPPDFSGTGAGVIQLSVLVPPTSPTCQSNGNTLTGQDATLTCSSTGNPPPVYTWSRVGTKSALLPGMMESTKL
ncbi:unnamed protein product [Ranitomeya imitator]|uniref:Ig-like domain-containing protein n=1 Tax=Ranitomeya imitator TaxID=111125 RepID=A0ABN9MJW9_9NEOB|nr:unnamed protein product [Ranitomeya imitator]